MGCLRRSGAQSSTVTMGGGNAQKSAIARERNAAAAKARAGGNSNLKSKDKDMAYQCKVCKQQFMCTAAIELMEQHVENKHKGKTYEDCFDWIYVAAPNMATVYKGSRAAHAAFGVCGRVYVYMCVYVCLC